MFVTDDKHVDELVHEGHIDCMVRRAIAAGVHPAHAVRMASFNAASYFGLHETGAVAPGYVANLTVLEELTRCRVTSTYKEGQLVAADGACVLPEDELQPRAMRLRSSINVQWLERDAFSIPVPPGADSREARIIQIVPDQLVTHEVREVPPMVDHLVVADPRRDLLKMAVIERHTASGRIGLGLVRGFGLQRGAIASTIAHDAHNLIVVGTTDQDMLAAAVHLVKIRGGLCAVADGKVLADLPLPVAGLISEEPAQVVVERLTRLRQAARSLGTPLDHPFMTLAFMSLSVIGDLKLTDHGLADITIFKHVGLFA
jgi:adenine deaminase